ncbi:MAG: MerR family transcriptional regulator [Paracoccaceae bacterium]
MRISEVAKKTGLTVSTIRYYEKRSVTRLPKRNGRERVYSEDDLRRLRFVQKAPLLGMPLRDIAEILQKQWSKGEMAPVLSRHRRKIQSQIEAFKRMENALAQLETCTCSGVLDCELANSDG